jgi:hypothetical protein
LSLGQWALPTTKTTLNKRLHEAKYLVLHQAFGTAVAWRYRDHNPPSTRPESASDAIGWRYGMPLNWRRS